MIICIPTLCIVTLCIVKPLTSRPLAFQSDLAMSGMSGVNSRVQPRAGDAKWVGDEPRAGTARGAVSRVFASRPSRHESSANQERLEIDDFVVLLCSYWTVGMDDSALTRMTPSNVVRREGKAVLFAFLSCKGGGLRTAEYILL